MGTVLGTKLRGDASVVLLDRSLTRFINDYLGWINDAQITAAALKPDISVGVRNKALVAGVYQTISSDAHALIRPIRNMGTDGNTPGTRIQTADYDLFENNNPDWMSAEPSATVDVIMVDERNDGGFFCFPPQPETGQGHIQVVEAIVPPRLANINQPITINDIHEPHLFQYMLFRGYSATSSPIAKNSAMSAWNMFVTGLGRKDMVDKVFSPNMARKILQGEMPNGG
jgi:hypothetical protein